MTDCDELTLAYLAGIVDADGYITITKFARTYGVYYSARVGIAGTRNAPHVLAASIFGGSVREYRNRHHRPQFQWSRQGPNAVVVIDALRPFLRVKKEQALLALNLQHHVETFDKSAPRLAERAVMYDRMVFDCNEGRGVKRP